MLTIYLRDIEPKMVSAWKEEFNTEHFSKVFKVCRGTCVHMYVLLSPGICTIRVLQYEIYGLGFRELGLGCRICGLQVWIARIA